MSDSIETRIAEVLREHELGYNAPGGFCCISIDCDWYGHDLDFPDHVAAEVVAALRLRELDELLRYFVDSPKGWVGEGREVAEDALAVLRGEPVSDGWRRAIAEARDAGWERTE